MKNFQKYTSHQVYIFMGKKHLTLQNAEQQHAQMTLTVQLHSPITNIAHTDLLVLKLGC